MVTIVRGAQDRYVSALKNALEEYEKQMPGATADVYRQNSASVRIRVVDQHFGGMSKADRHEELWKFLEARVDRDVLEEVSVLLPLAPSELERSLANIDFEHPQRSEL